MYFFLVFFLYNYWTILLNRGIIDLNIPLYHCPLQSSIITLQMEQGVGQEDGECSYDGVNIALVIGTYSFYIPSYPLTLYCVVL